ncbi:MAG TPA: hypothetical protein PKA00_05360 [Saprospiraceae bacterium]|nr:hypothetical protein [Saprospiraceae bacterium]HMQ82310.1 hypothetical protein [Saprospiraceae bacterium]
MQSDRFLLIVCMLVGFVWACNKQQTEDYPIDYGYDYFPLAVGTEYIYQVDSIVYKPVIGGIQADSSTTFVRELTVDSLLDESGKAWYRVEQYQRKQDTLPWQITRVLMLRRNEAEAIRTEENLRFIKLRFPIKANESWDGNAAFDASRDFAVSGENMAIFKNWNYLVLESNGTYQEGAINLDEVITVQNADNENLIERRSAVERYARGVGLVYREWGLYDTQCEACCASDFALCEPLSWPEKAEKGVMIRQRLLAFHF